MSVKCSYRAGRIVSVVMALVIPLAISGCSDSSIQVSAPNSTDPGSSSVPPPGTIGTGVIPLDEAHRDAARFLTQSTFGPTYEQIESLAVGSDYASWIENQFTQPASATLNYVTANSNGSERQAMHDIWWRNALDGPDQLRQRITFALSQIFVVSDIDYVLGNAQYGISSFYDMLSDHAFGNYRDLLRSVTLHPVMGVYLSMVRNEKANVALNIRPDENFAREVLQLFSVGLYRLNLRGEALPIGNPEPSYSQKTVEEFARVFTGWNYPNSVSWTDNNFSNELFQSPMVPFEEFHDTGAKTLLNGAVLPSGQTATQDLDAALDNIFFHPNVGPFISKLLIQRLVTSNPTPDYIERIAIIFNNNGAGERGDLRAVVKAILLDDEARTGHRQDVDFGKIKEPLIKLAHFFRALSAKPGPLSGGVHSTASFPLYRLDEMLNQAVMRSKSVFNFYQPDHAVSPGSPILAPELQILTESALSLTHNNYHHQIYRFTTRSDLSDDNPRVTLIDLEPLVDVAAYGGNLIDWLNLVFFGGEMPLSTAVVLSNHIESLNARSDEGRYARVTDALFLMTGSPAFNLQR